MDHLPLTTAIASAANRSPRQARHLSYVAEFTTDLRHLPGKSNVVADALSRSCAELNAVLASPINFRNMATDQQTDPDSIYYKDKVNTGMVLREVNIRGITLLCDTALGVPDLSFQHHGVRRCLTLSTVSPIWVRSPLSRQSPVNLFGPACTGISPAGASCAGTVIRARLANILTPPCKPSWSRNDRFDHLHVDIVGPLSPSRGFTYLFTVIDRFTRWTEAIPMSDSTASTCDRALFREWISRFGVPGELTSDRGPQFTSELWDQLHHILGTKAYRTTSYHPQANGMVE